MGGFRNSTNTQFSFRPQISSVTIPAEITPSSVSSLPAFWLWSVTPPKHTDVISEHSLIPSLSMCNYWFHLYHLCIAIRVTWYTDSHNYGDTYKLVDELISLHLKQKSYVECLRCVRLQMFDVKIVTGTLNCKDTISCRVGTGLPSTLEVLNFIELN